MKQFPQFTGVSRALSGQCNLEVHFYQQVIHMSPLLLFSKFTDIKWVYLYV